MIWNIVLNRRSDYYVMKKETGNMTPSNLVVEYGRPLCLRDQTLINDSRMSGIGRQRRQLLHSARFKPDLARWGPKRAGDLTEKDGRCTRHPPRPYLRGT